MRFRSRSRALLLVLAMLAGAPAVAAPFIPAEDGEVLAEVSPASDPRERELRLLGAALARDPRNAALATQVARAALQRARATGDPRDAGRAEAALAPWWNQAQPPLPILVLRASLRQYRHDFAGGLADLDAALARDPGAAQARLSRAVLHTVQGRYEAARRDCTALRGAVEPLIAASCDAGIDAMTGAAATAIAALDTALTAAPAAAPGLRAWALTLQAQAARRIGDPRAEALFTAALQAMAAEGVPDLYLLVARADALLAAGRDAEVLALLEPQPRTDALLLRRARAAQRLRLEPEYGALAAALAQRFEGSARRGEAADARELALHALWIGNDAGLALAQAQANWQVQREAIDAWLVLAAAADAGRPEAAAPVRAFIEQHRIEGFDGAAAGAP